jgi:DNA-binding NarL/FixJ family response regulator
MSLRVALADDSVLFREGVARVLADLGFDVVGQAANGDELLSAVAAEQPDVAVIDLRMPPTRTDEGLRTALEISACHPGVGVVLLSQYLDARYALRLLADGAPGRGYLLKDRIADLESFRDALVQVADGGSVVDPEVVQALVDARDMSGPLVELTQRELEILQLMAQGRSNAGVCDRLHLSPRTVESHIRIIMQKLGLPPADDDHRRVLAVLAYLQAPV